METKDFTGFTFDNVHSDELGIVRVSDGDRYKDNLQPEIKDLISEVPGMDGEYYFGSNYGTREFEINIAYDSLTEEQIRLLRKTFGDKQIHRLIFDEQPYKAYLVKLANPIELSYVCFDERKKRAYGDEEEPYKYGVRKINGERERIYPWVYEDEVQRIYKGDGTINLIAHYPFAKNVIQTLDESDYFNLNEWKDASGILTQTEYESFDKYKDEIVHLYNPGDRPTGIKIYCPFVKAKEEKEYQELRLEYHDGEEIKLILLIKDIDKHPNDIGFLINTETQLVQGVSVYSDKSNYALSGTIYNRYVKGGTFFKIAPSKSKEVANNPYLKIDGGNSEMKFFYDYLYI